MIVHRIRLAALFSACTMAVAAAPATAANFDGEWSMVAVTTRGHCGTVDIGLGIKRGRLYATGGFFAFYPITITGRVSGSGHAQLSAVAGPRVARGTGRFGREGARGTWSGRGPSGLCSGVWRASRT